MSSRMLPTRKLLQTGYGKDKIEGLYKGARWRLLRLGYVVEI